MDKNKEQNEQTEQIVENEQLNEKSVDETEAKTKEESLEEQYLEKLQRTMAEFDNYKKRTAKERQELYSVITSDAMVKFLPVIDNLETALKAIEGKDKSITDGINLILKQFKDVLKSFEVEEIETKGVTFNPDLHEAVIHVEDDNFGEGEIIEELRKGYICKGRVLRYSMVKVAN